MIATAIKVGETWYNSASDTTSDTIVPARRHIGHRISPTSRQQIQGAFFTQEKKKRIKIMTTKVGGKYASKYGI